VLCLLQRYPTNQLQYSNSRFDYPDDYDYYSYYGRRHTWQGQLPADLLPSILQYADCSHRLSSCALVARAWKAAATAASKDINLTLPYNNRTTGNLAEWLQKHGSVVQSFAVTFNHQNEYGNGTSATTVALPFQQLKHLRNLEVVNGFSAGKSSVRLQCFSGTSTQAVLNDRTPPGSSSSGSVSAPINDGGTGARINPLEYVSCSLTSLKLHCIDFVDLSVRVPEGYYGYNGYKSMTALTALQLLDFKQRAAEEPATTLALAETLPQLATLTKLHLEWQFGKKLKAAVGQLTKLQELRLCQQRDNSGDPYYHGGHDGHELSLPQSLTHLEVQLPHSFCEACTPSLASLTALQHLQLKDITELDPTMMTHMKGLTHLELCMRGIPEEHMLELLGALPGMQQLRHLQLEFSGDGAPSVGWLDCRRLMSSSHLTSLQLRGVKLPNACGRQLFCGRKLPHLRVLSIRCAVGKYDTYHASASQSLYGVADVCSLIDCCPKLVELDLVGVVGRGVSLSCLSQLQHLTELTVGGPSIDNLCAMGIAEVTGLKKLTIIDPAGYNAGDTAAGWQYGGGWGGTEEGDATVVDHGGSFDFRGLRSLMRLTGLSTFVVGRDSFLFYRCGNRCYSDYGYEDVDVVTEFNSPVS
jgi:hypothetical protein